MILQMFRDLEQQFRDEAEEILEIIKVVEARSSRVGSTSSERGLRHRCLDHAQGLSAVRRTLEARLEGLERFAVNAREHHPAAGNDIPFCRMERNNAGAFVTVADLAACLVGTQEPKDG